MGDGRAKRNYAVALAIMDTEEVTNDTRILIGVRRPESNAQHANVMSVPTQRIPGELFGAVVMEVGSDLVPCNRHAGDNVVTYVVQSVMAQKLSMGHRIELGHVWFSAAVRSVFAEVTPILSEGDEAVKWKMALIAVHLACGRGEVPEGTCSYADLTWLRVKDFMAKVEEGGLMAVELRSYVVGGLCVESTAKWLAEAVGGDGDGR